MSSRHVEIVRSLEGGVYRWLLRDLNSTNGTFVRATDTLLRDGQEVLLGGSRFRFEMDRPSLEARAQDEMPSLTRKWQVGGSAPNTNPRLVELTAEGEGRHYRLTGNEVWIGRDPKQSTIVLTHPEASPRHARVARDEKGHWTISNNKSRDGLWARVQKVAVPKVVMFQCGEQRFFFRIV